MPEQTLPNAAHRPRSLLQAVRGAVPRAAFVSAVLLHVSSAHGQAALFPKSGAVDVNPDTRLKLTFASPPPLGNKGKIQIYDASSDKLVDELDLSIPPGPRNTRTPPPYDTLKYSSIPDTVFTVNSPDTDTSHVYQKNFIGGTAEADAHHFFPVLINDAEATVTPHNGRLEYGKTYYVQIDPDVFPTQDSGFAGIAGKTAWTFTTKKSAPSASAGQLVVAADGTGDFSTVQAALDFVPDANPNRKEIFIKSGIYEEMVAFRNKQNITIRGEDRAKTVVRYANNGVFNRAGRAEFAVFSSTAINLVNFTIQTVGKDENPAQAEALYVKGDKTQVHNVTMLGSGDALQIQLGTRLYVSRSSVRGYGDNLLSYGAAFFKECELISTYGPHGWPRNPNSNHGDVFLNSTFRLEGKGTSGDGHCDLARSPTSGASFPYAEFVLIGCKLDGIAPEGWGGVGPDTSNVHFWEYNSVNLSDGKPVDVSKRVSYSRQLTMSKDAEAIANYSNPSYVLDGWTPELAPAILTQLPDSLAVPVGGTATLSIDVAAEPAPTYQWFKDGQPLMGKVDSSLKLDGVADSDSGDYYVVVENSLGKATSEKTALDVGGAGKPRVDAGPATQAGTSDAGMSASGAAGTGTRAGADGGSRAGSSTAPGTSGTTGGQDGASETATGSSGTPDSDGPDAPGSRPSAGGCRVDQARGTSGASAGLLLAILFGFRAYRRRGRAQRPS